MTDTLNRMVEKSRFHSEDYPMAAATPVVDREVVHIIPDPTVVEPLELEGVPIVPLSPEDTQSRVMMGAGVAAGVVGLLVGGPLLGCVAGFSLAYAAKQQGATGDVARAVGQVALVAQSKAKEVNQKHNLVGKTQVAANKALERAKELDRKHSILARTKEFMVYSWQTVTEVNRQHRVLERSVEGVGKALSYVGRKLVASLASSTTPDQQASGQALHPEPSAPFEPLPPPMAVPY